VNKPPRLLKQHRFARITLWARPMLAWLMAALFSQSVRVDRRRIRQRYRFASLDWIERLVCALAIIRAIAITGIAKRTRALRNAAPTGFRRRIRPSAGWRATVGSRLRKALKHRDPRQRIQRLLAALADIDAFARRHLVRRALRRLTKLCAIILIAPPADTIVSLAAPSACAADTS
jgi:hypothetical protein